MQPLLLAAEKQEQPDVGPRPERSTPQAEQTAQESTAAG
jgi:hypothetical protein